VAKQENVDKSLICDSSVAIGNPERHVCKALHRDSKQQLRSCVAISLIIACSLHAYVFLFFAHIPFVVNHTINATPPERLQQQDIVADIWLTFSQKIVCFEWSLENSRHGAIARRIIIDQYELKKHSVTNFLKREVWKSTKLVCKDVKNLNRIPECLLTAKHEIICIGFAHGTCSALEKAAKRLKALKLSILLYAKMGLLSPRRLC